MKYYIYQITNTVNGKIYVGVHKTKNLDDGYMGSGKIIRLAIAKHGAEHFKKDILEFFENAELMYAREKEIVTDEFLLREDVYNLRRGGDGGFDYINDSSDKHIERCKRAYSNGLGKTDLSEMNKKIYQKMKQNGTGLYSEKTMQECKERWKDLQKIGRLASNSPEVQEKKKETFAEIGHQQGNKNSQFGTFWCTNGELNIKLKSGQDIPEGYTKGRSIKK